MSYVNQLDKTAIPYNIFSNNINSDLSFITSLQWMLCRWYWIIYTTLQNILMLTTAIANILCAHPDNEYIKMEKSDLHEVKNQILKANVFERTKWHKLPTEFLWGTAL